MNESQFHEKNIPIWTELETILSQLKKRDKSHINSEHFSKFLGLYNQASAHLAYAQTNFPNSDLSIYLNNLVAGCHSIIYSEKKSYFKDFINFFRITFPCLFRQNFLFFLLSSSIFIFGIGISYIITYFVPSDANIFLGEMSINTDKIGESTWNNPVISSQILTNNIKVGLLSFAFGVTAGLGTIYVLFKNGALLGSLWAIVALNGPQLEFWSLILPHGVLELFAIFVCGMSGLIIGRAIINPGQYSRKDALIARGKIAVTLTVGTVPLFVIAGIIEGYFTPSSFSPITKLVFSFLSLCVIVLYVGFSGKNKNSIV